MKKLLVLLALTFILLNDMYSQEKNTSKEVGLYFSSLNSFGVRYKFGNEKRMFRLTALSLSVGDGSDNDGTGFITRQKSAGAGLNFGVELPIRITDVFNFYYGPELRGSFNRQNYFLSPSIHQIIKEYSGGIGLILGFSRSFQSNITASVEIVPGFSYNKKLDGNIETIDYGFGLSSNTAAITIGYRF